MGGATEFDGIVLRVFECPILELRVIDEQGGRSFRPTKKEILFLRLLYLLLLTEVYLTCIHRILQSVSIRCDRPWNERRHDAETISFRFRVPFSIFLL